MQPAHNIAAIFFEAENPPVGRLATTPRAHAARVCLWGQAARVMPVGQQLALIRRS